MFKHIATYIAIASTLWLAAACNDDSETFDTSADYASTQVTAFSLKSNPDVLNNLDSIYFSIDLANALIYNADSLPYGTKVNRLLVSLTTDGCSTVELHYPRAEGKDSIVDYLKSPNDSIDFSLGDVKLHLVSYDKIASRDYYIRVNVHTTVSDSLTWFFDDNLTVPTSLSAITDQRTVQYGNDIYTFTTDDNQQACLSIATSPADAGTYSTFTFPFQADLRSLTATSTAIYILDTDGNLYSSPDGTTWSSCGVTWHSITAPYGSTLLGTAYIDGRLTHVSFPAGISATVKPDFPVTGTSAAIPYSTEWSHQSQIIIVGGLKENGEPANSAWGFDGNSWACLNNDTPMAAEGLTIFPYYCCQTDTNTWIASTKSVLIAMGGKGATEMQDTIYMSYDLGFHWTKAPDLMQLPEEFPSLHSAQAIVSNTTHTSRAARPITEWDTPYIYVYGGYTSDDKISPRVYRGVVNRLSFKPLQ